MIKDLKLAGETAVTCDAHICIVGAGMAGLFLAHLLRQQGLAVVLLEAGSLVARSSTEMGERCVQKGKPYRGDERGRSFGVGGTTALWGGQMIRMMEADFGARSGFGVEAWPIDCADVANNISIVSRYLGVGAEDLSSGSAPGNVLETEFGDLCNLSPDLVLRLSEWLPFEKRNFAKTFATSVGRDQGLTVWLNAAVTSMSRSGVGEDARIDTVTAHSTNGRALHVRAIAVVICAGALESTRLMLAFDETSNGTITGTGAPLGRYFSDHLSVTCGRFHCRDWRRYNFAVASIFRHGVMRTPRLELTARTQRELGLMSAFAHFPFVTSGETGFDLVRNVLRRRQGERRRFKISTKMLAEAVTGIASMGYWRSVHRRLRIPRNADMLLQVDIEQAPNFESRLFLSPERDALNRNRLVIDWKIGPADIRAIHNVAEIVATAWRNSPLSQVADLQPTLQDGFDIDAALYDVYHPTGSMRMGVNAATSVVDRNLRLWATRNCYLSTTAVFPSTGSANPGLTHLALTARLATTIARRFCR